MRSVQSQLSEGEYSLVVFIGTHRDLEHLSPQTCSEKNERLRAILPTDERGVLFYGDQLIHPLNTKTPSPEDRKVAAELCREIIKHSPAKPSKVPLQWYGLEVALQKLMEELERGVVSKKECQAVAATLYFTPESFEAALKYLAELNLILYYESVLPDVVFCSSQVILDKVSELVQFSYLLRGSPSMIVDGTMKRFYEQGLVTLEFLSHERFSRHYVNGLFGPEQLLQLLEKLLLVAKVSDSEYLLPFTLPVIKGEEIDTSPSTIPPLLLYFPNGGPRLGVFCHLIAYLLSKAKWKLLFHDRTPVQVARNTIAFALPDSLPGRVTICDSLSTYFFACVSTAFHERLSEICPHVHATLLAGLRHVINNLEYKESDPQDAFLCSVEGSTCSSPPHPATVGGGSGRGLLVCSLCPENGRRMTDKEQIWFSSATTPIAGSVYIILETPACIRNNICTAHLQ